MDNTNYSNAIALLEDLVANADKDLQSFLTWYQSKENLIHQTIKTGDIELRGSGEMGRTLLQIIGKIVDDNNFLPGHPEVIVAMKRKDHNKLQDIYYHWEMETEK